jgi:hypothetical protein
MGCAYGRAVRWVVAWVFAAAAQVSVALPSAPASPVRNAILPFSGNPAGAKLPRGWQGLVIARTKAATQYELIVDPETKRVVLRARAENAATGLKQLLDVDPKELPVIAWQWRVTNLIASADNTKAKTEDAPVRLMLFFDGDVSKLSTKERLKMQAARVVSGESVPYATLMYIWENRQPVGTVIESPHTTRLRMLVAASGADRLGQWRQFERNYSDDFRLAFNEAPGKLVGVGILTDTDNTDESVEAFYGDIELRRAPQ